MNVLVITDQHFGVRNDSLIFLERYRQFYSQIVIPTIDKMGITEVLCLGDTFDKRKTINFNSLDAAKEMWFDPLRDRGVTMNMLIGNHDIYFKNTLKVNAPELLLQDYGNINIIDVPGDYSIGGRDMCCIPWVCDESRDTTRDAIETSAADICVGHLELSGFEAIPGIVMSHGDDSAPYDKFDMVLSGHYHLKSKKKNIQYLGNPNQLYWNDYGQKKGFHILNTNDLALSFTHNPYEVFHKIFYSETTIDDIKGLDFTNTYVKLIVDDKTDQAKFDQTIRYIQCAGVADLKIIEDNTYILEDATDVEVEDTLTILETCVQELPHKEEIFAILKNLYMESVEV